jgi:hypothetical protein
MAPEFARPSALMLDLGLDSLRRGRADFIGHQGVGGSEDCERVPEAHGWRSIGAESSSPRVAIASEAGKRTLTRSRSLQIDLPRFNPAMNRNRNAASLSAGGTETGTPRKRFGSPVLSMIERLRVDHHRKSTVIYCFVDDPWSQQSKSLSTIHLPLDCLRTIRHLPQPVDPRVWFTRRLKGSNSDKVAYRLTSLLSPSSG